ncbi:hypothetical protein [Rickettsia gravesii]|uniref:hypothetical protein n=1 Tax=Rickettsia gravesii TaxID=354585 RepID=UPI0004AE8F5A|nr:hypothetical protein [Rickettsia gravesii]
MSIIDFSSFSRLNKEQQEELQRLLIKLKGFTKSLKNECKRFRRSFILYFIKFFK